MLDGDAFADDVRDDIDAARQIGISGVPFFVVDGRLGVSGAQPPESLLDIIEQGWLTREPAPVHGRRRQRHGGRRLRPRRLRDLTRGRSGRPVSVEPRVPPVRHPAVARGPPSAPPADRSASSSAASPSRASCRPTWGSTRGTCSTRASSDSTGIPIGTVSVLVSFVVVLGLDPAAPAARASAP